MKFKLVERFVNRYQWEDHYKRHAIIDGHYPNLSKEEYLDKAEQLADRPVDMFKIQGYMTRSNDGRAKYIKWNRDTNDFVVYGRESEGSEPIIISMYKVPPKQFRGRAYSSGASVGEIPYGM
jgi:hypothetical protein